MLPQIAQWDVKMPQITDKEKEGLLAQIQKAEEWLEEKQEAQLAKSPYEEPAFDSDDVTLQFKQVRLGMARQLRGGFIFVFV